MRHGIAGNKLGRNSTLRKATMRDLTRATLIHQRIETTLAIAKEARKYVDRMVTLGKKGTLAHKRRAFSFLCDHNLVSELFLKIAPRFNDRKGGYTRIIPLAQRRLGDNAQMALLELTEKSAEPVKKSKVEVKANKSSSTIDIEANPETKTKSPAIEPAKPKTKHPGTEEKSQAAKPKGGVMKRMFQRKVGGE